MKKLIFKKVIRQQKSMKNYPACKELTGLHSYQVRLGVYGTAALMTAKVQHFDAFDCNLIMLVFAK